MTDPTETFRRTKVAEINGDIEGDAFTERKRLEAKYGKVWSTNEMTAEFDCLGFMAPYIQVIRKIDNVKGTLTFQHMPRFYFDFREYTDAAAN